MNYTPNIREKIVSTDEGKKSNPFWQGNLSQNNQYMLKGYDASVGEMEDFFTELKLYEDEFKNALGVEKFETDLNAVSADISDAEWKKLPDTTKLLVTLKRCMYNYLELSRNELGISLMPKK